VTPSSGFVSQTTSHGSCRAQIPDPHPARPPPAAPATVPPPNPPQPPPAVPRTATQPTPTTSPTTNTRHQPQPRATQRTKGANLHPESHRQPYRPATSPNVGALQPTHLHQHSRQSHQQAATNAIASHRRRRAATHPTSGTHTLAARVKGTEGKGVERVREETSRVSLVIIVRDCRGCDA